MNNPEKDIEQLNLLATFHYVFGGIVGVFSCTPLFHVAMGIWLLTGTFSGDPPPTFFGYMFVFMGLFLAIMGWTLAICIIITARKLKQKTHHSFCFVMVCVECILVPFGTILGILTIIALSKDSVRTVFNPPCDRSA